MSFISSLLNGIPLSLFLKFFDFFIVLNKDSQHNVEKESEKDILALPLSLVGKHLLSHHQVQC